MTTFKLNFYPLCFSVSVSFSFCASLSLSLLLSLSILLQYIRDLYCKKFPELDSLVLHPLEYAKTVQVVQNETHISKLDDELRAILTPATVMVVTVTATTTKGVALTPLELEYVLEGCDLILFLDQCRSKIIEYVRSRMDMIAPNLSAIVGSTTAAQLMGAAGGLSALSRIPACNLPVRVSHCCCCC